MKSRREQVWTGMFVLVATAVLIAVVLAVSGSFSAPGSVYRAYFQYAGGLAPAAPVRYGGLLAGKVVRLGVDPRDSRQIAIEFRVAHDIPLKTDSIAKITTLGALGESYLEITTGGKDTPLAPPGSVIRSREMVSISDLGELISGLAPVADQVLRSLNERLGEIKVTIAQVNELTGEPNRKSIGNSLATLNAMLTETRPKLAATLDNVHAASSQLSPILAHVQIAAERITPLLEDLKGTIKQANVALANIDAVVVENRPEIRASMMDTRKTLATASRLVELLKTTLDRNTDNLDDTLVNVREATDNLKQMTDTLKRKPSVLIRGETGKDRLPGTTK
jgi:phospholipid/cholesterol/gamma-HCH transport system substrate-binding protein